SRGSGMGDTWWARSMSSSVVSPMAETATTTSLPALRVSTIRLATRLMLSASATLEPPNFCTIRDTEGHSRGGRGLRHPTEGRMPLGSVAVLRRRRCRATVLRAAEEHERRNREGVDEHGDDVPEHDRGRADQCAVEDRKSTRLNSSHVKIS